MRARVVVNSSDSGKSGERNPQAAYCAPPTHLPHFTFAARVDRSRVLLVNGEIDFVGVNAKFLSCL